MNKQYRLKKSHEIENLFKNKKSVGNIYYAMYFKKSSTNKTRVAISVSKKLGNAVTRNKEKRIIREIIRCYIDIINNLAENSSCVIVGRGADYILRKRDDVLNIFIKASMEHKVMLSKEKHDLTNKEAKTILLKRDKERSKHYYFYTGQNWGDAKNYHLVLDSGVLGEETCVKLIVEAFKNS